ncbi:MAG TPA: GFA family protein [Caulobacteraceae bacterium]|nr:GFA family protein [Caulobacteraceae bacterium]
MIRGGCLCGAVGYEAEGFSGPVVHCHCRTCQKSHSAAFNTTGRALRSGFRWTRGDEVRRSFESTPGKLRWFCSQCGAHLMAEWVAADQVILRVGSVDEGMEGVTPAAHIWTSFQAPWDHGADDLPRHAEGMPG